MDKIRIGFLLDNHTIAAWEYYFVDKLIKAEYAEPVCIMLKPETSSAENLKSIQKDPLIIRLLEKLTSSQSMAGRYYNDLIGSSDVFAGLPVISTEFSDKDFSASGFKSPQVILDLRNSSLAAELNFSPLYGIWRIIPDNRLIINGIFSSFWEMISTSPAVRMDLRIKIAGDQPQTINISTYESILPFSQQLNRNKAYWRAALLIPRVVEGLCRNGEDYLRIISGHLSRKDSPDEVLVPEKGMIRKLRNFIYFLKALLIQITKKLFFGIEEEWQVMTDFQPEQAPSFSFDRFRKLEPPEGLYWADPFVVVKDGRYFLFVEEISFSSPNAHLAVLELNNAGKVLSREKILEKPYHLSYPFVFKYLNEYYLIPETSGNNTIDLYRCSQFPGKWEFVRTIMSGFPAVDTTLFEYGGKWWLFTSVDKTLGLSGLDTDLYVYYSDDPLGCNWTSHPLNPVISDVRTARPAGKIFAMDGNIYRPSQDCSGRYGRAFNINRILKLTETDFREEVVRTITPYWDKKLKGAHTYNFDSGLTVIDAYAYRKRSTQKHYGRNN